MGERNHKLSLTVTLCYKFLNPPFYSQLVNVAAAAITTINLPVILTTLFFYLFSKWLTMIISFFIKQSKEKIFFFFH